MKAMIPIVLMVLMVCGQAAFCQSPPLYMPYQPPPTPQYAPASAPPVQAPPPQPVQRRQASMYDQSYRGPYNMYGQPVITGYRRQQTNQQAQQQTVHNGIFPRVIRGIGGFGNYLWTYMPAPVRGVGSPYEVPPGEAVHTVNFVPNVP